MKTFELTMKMGVYEDERLVACCDRPTLIEIRHRESAMWNCESCGTQDVSIFRTKMQDIEIRDDRDDRRIIATRLTGSSKSNIARAFDMRNGIPHRHRRNRMFGRIKP